MKTKQPSYLRIHRVPGSSPASSDPPAKSPPLDSQFWAAFAGATGWRFDPRSEAAPHLVPSVTTDPLGVEPVVAIDAGATAKGYVYEDDGPSLGEEVGSIAALPAVGRDAAGRLADTAKQLIADLDKARQTIRSQNAELAARASVLAGENASIDLATALDETLADTAAACDCDAAILFLLDDDTETLTPRAMIGHAELLVDDIRLLRDARGDLEAMVRGIVLVNDFSIDPLNTHGPPSDRARAGICVTVKQDDLPIGTLWLLADQRRSFTRRESAAAMLAVKHIAVLLHSVRPSSSSAAEPAKADVGELTQWQFLSLPPGSSLAEDFRVDGMIESPRSFATGWHTWDVLPDGSLMWAIAESMDSSMRGAMVAATARAALTSHAGYRHTPGALLSRLADTLWQTSSDDQLLSILYVRVDPITGEAELAAAGNLVAMIASRYGMRPLVDGRDEPLGMHIDARPRLQTFRLDEGETLLAHTNGLTEDGLSQYRIGEVLIDAMKQGSRSPLAALRRSIADVPMHHERGAATLLRM